MTSSTSNDISKRVASNPLGINLKEKFYSVLSNVMSQTNRDNYNYRNNSNKVNVFDKLITMTKSPSSFRKSRNNSQLNVNYLSEYSDKLQRDKINKTKKQLISILTQKDNDDVETLTARKFSKMKSDSCKNIFISKPKIIIKREESDYSKHLHDKQTINKMLDKISVPNKIQRDYGNVNSYRKEAEYGLGIIKKQLKSKSKIKNNFLETKKRNSSNFFLETSGVEDLFEKVKYRK